MNLWCINQLNQLIIGAQHLVRILTSKVSRPGINEISERRPLHCCISTSTDERDERDEVQFGGFHSPRESTAFMDLLHLLYKQSPHKSEDMFLYRNVESVSPIGVVVAKLWLLGDCSFGPLICSHISHFSGGSSSSRSFSILAHLSLGISHTFSHLLSSSHISALLLFSPVLNSSRLFSDIIMMVMWSRGYVRLR